MRAPVLLLSALAAACAAPGDERHSPLAAAQRVLAIDFGAQALPERLAGLQRAPAALAAEFQRAPKLQQSLPALRPELARLPSARLRLSALVDRESGRHPASPIPLAHLPQRWTQTIVNALANVPYVLGLHRRPLAEPTDRQHRTDPFDARPEAGWLARISRRLRLSH